MKLTPAMTYRLLAASILAVVLIAVLVLGGNVPEPEDTAGITELKRTADADPRNVAVRLDLGHAYQTEGRLDSAVMEYDRVLKEDPANTAALYNRAVVHRETGLLKKAEEGFWRVLELEPDHVQAATQLGRLYADKGHFKSLLFAVEPVLESRPESAELQYLAGLANERLGRADKARLRYEEAVALSPNHREAREGLERLGGAR